MKSLTFKYEEKGSLSVRFLDDDGNQVSMPPATWEALGRPEQVTVIADEETDAEART